MRTVVVSFDNAILDRCEEPFAEARLVQDDARGRYGTILWLRDGRVIQAYRANVIAATRRKEYGS